MTCFFMWWLNSKQLSHRAQCYVISLAWLFMCIVWWFLMLLLNISSTRNHLFLQSAFNRANSCWVLLALPLPIPSTRNHIVLLHGVFNMVRILLGNAGPPLTIPSTSNHPFLRQGAFNRARIMLDIANLPLTISSTRNHHFHVYGAKIILVIAGLSFTVPYIRNYFSYSSAWTGQGSGGCCRPPSDYSIQQESSLSDPWSLKLGKDHVWCHWCPSDYFIHQE